MIGSSNNDPNLEFSNDAADSTPSLKRVYVIDESEVVLNIVSLLLEQAGYTVQAYQFSAQFAEESENLPSGVIVTDQVMNPVDGGKVQGGLLNRPSQFRVILVTACPNTSLTVAAMKSGAVTVLEKPFERQELIEAIEEGFQQLQNSQAFGQALPGVPVGDMAFLDRLSHREREVIELVYEGGTNKSISSRLGISAKTVEKHRSKAMKKLAVSSLAELIRLIARILGQN